jgi:tetratricopeptide (TPR) repeat protein
MKPALLFFLAAATLHFDITDARGKKPSGISIETSAPDADDWYTLSLTGKYKGNPVLIWPYDGKAKAADGPESIPVIVIEKGDPKAAANPHVVACIAAAHLLGVNRDIGLDLAKPTAALSSADEPFAKGIGLLAANKPVDAVEPLAIALRERERQLTRVPSEIYPLAMLNGKALFAAGKFDAAAVAYLKAIKQRPSDPAARKARAEALIKAGKPEAAEPIQ